MSLPRAVASGPAAVTPDAVRPLRVAVGAGVLAAVYLLVLYVVAPLPTSLLARFGGAEDDLERYGGLEMVWRPPAGMADEEVLERYRAGEDRAQVRRGGDGFVIRVPRVRREDVDETAQRLGGGRVLAFHRVLETDEMKQLVRLLGLPMRGERPVDIETDQWRPEDHGVTHTDYYLIGDSIEAIEAKLAEARAKGWALPAGSRIAYEAIAADDELDRLLYRTYVIDERVELGGEHVADAQHASDPYMNRPLVLLDFDREGANRFGELTAQIVGSKLAILVGGEVRSAPIINGPIRGGRASITMGSSDVAQQQREAELLVNTLRAGMLPPGGTIVQARHVEPLDDASARWLARGALVLGGGVLIALLACGVVRVTRPVHRSRRAATEGRRPWRRLVVTLLAVPAVYAVSQVTALGIDEAELVHQLGSASSGDGDGALLAIVRVGALGILPVISAFILVELLALVIPGWRRRRHAGPEARWTLHAAVAITAATLLIVQGWFATQYLSSLGDVLPLGVWPRVLVIASFAVGTLVLVGVAAFIRAHGLGNGFGALLVAGWLVALVDHGRLGPLLAGDVAVGAMTMLAIAIPVAVVARWRIARLAEPPLRLPSSGIIPLAEAGGLALVVAVSMKFPVEDLTYRLYDLWMAARTEWWLIFALVAGLSIVWSFAFARPGVTRALAERVGLVGAAPRTWWAATLLSAALLLLVGAVASITSREQASAVWLGDAIATAMLAAVVLDLVEDWRGRRVVLDRVWSLHQPQHADLVSRALDDAGIPHHLSATNLRTLLAFFGPFVPIDVLVPPEHVPAAREKLRELFG